MPKIRVTKKFHFEMAHALYEYDGICRNIHGHTYHLEVTIIGEVEQVKGYPKDGMVMDFSILKKLVQDQIIQHFDHALVVNSLFPDDHIQAFQKATERLIVVDFQPTTENLVIHFSKILQQALPLNVSLFCMRLYETEDSYAEWFASDNP
jgi:6-pyruvoyltetrahydropterin/6-carboxytetrahydropterin synthase